MIETQSRPSRYNLAQNDVVLPAQFFAMLRRECPVQGERRLMIAILEDAIYCIQKYLTARSRAERKIFQEAHDWMLSENADPFSFRHVCDVTGLDPSYLRGGLERWCRGHLGPPSGLSNGHVPLDRCTLESRTGH